MYEENMGNFEFLETSFILMRNKVKKLQEINLKQKRGKLPLPLLKEKLENTSEILEALRLMISMLDYNNPETEEIIELYNTIGTRLSLANIDLDDEMYQNVIDIIEGFLDA